jgi:hypothetical protein
MANGQEPRSSTKPLGAAGHEPKRRVHHARRPVGRLPASGPPVRAGLPADRLVQSLPGYFCARTMAQSSPWRRRRRRFRSTRLSARGCRRSCRSSPTGWAATRSGGWSLPGPADRERQPAAAGRQTAGAPPGLGAGRPAAETRLTATWHARRITWTANNARSQGSVASTAAAESLNQPPDP